MDILLDTNTNDVVFVNGATPVTKTDFEVSAQRLKIRLQTFLAEYDFNLNYGVPWFQQILGHKISKVDIDNILRQQILRDPTILRITSFNSTFVDGLYVLNFAAVNNKETLVQVNDININL